MCAGHHSASLWIAGLEPFQSYSGAIGAIPDSGTVKAATVGQVIFALKPSLKRGFFGPYGQCCIMSLLSSTADDMDRIYVRNIVK